MKIYNLNNKELKKELINFNKTTYGKIVFLISYGIPFIITILLIDMVIILNKINYSNQALSFSIIFVFMVDIISFISGTKYFYSELKEYINKNK